MIAHKTLEESLTLLIDYPSDKPLSIQELLEILSGKGQLLILILFSLPFCLPIQIPGLSTPFGCVIALIGLRRMFGKHLWLPKFLLRKSLSPKIIQKIAQKTLTLVKKIKRFIHPRWHIVCDNKCAPIFNGLALFLMGLVLALPLPIPLSNIPAAWSIFLIALGVLEDDGLFVIIGYMLTITTLALLDVLLLGIKFLF